MPLKGAWPMVRRTSSGRTCSSFSRRRASRSGSASTTGSEASQAASSSSASGRGASAALAFLGRSAGGRGGGGGRSTTWPGDSGNSFVRVWLGALAGGGGRPPPAQPGPHRLAVGEEGPLGPLGPLDRHAGGGGVAHRRVQGQRV